MTRLEEIMQIKFADEEFGRAFKEIYAAAKLAAQIPINIETVPELKRFLDQHKNSVVPIMEKPFDYNQIVILNQLLDAIPLDVIKNRLATVIKDPTSGEYRFDGGQQKAFS